MSHNELLHNVEDVFSSSYTIPIYQRGYKWTENQVRILLEDINKFQNCENLNDERFYCLQNITITENKNSSNSFGVIDGQQRLTTLAILLAYLGKNELVEGKLNYAVREESGKFLREWILENNENLTIEKLEKEQKKCDYQDTHYFVQSIKTIDTWFTEEKQNKEGFRAKFTETLLKKVKLIVNKIHDTEQEKVFANLNSNKVHLSEVDLIRAMLITRCEENKPLSLPQSTSMERLALLFVESMAKSFEINEQRARRAHELDQYNIYWMDKDRITFFSKLIGNTKSQGIELLYLLYFYANKGTKTITEIQKEIEGFDSNTIKEHLTNILYFHHTLDEWYNDTTMYHYLGYLGFQDNQKIEDIWKEWKGAQSKENFKNILKGWIKKSLFKNEDGDFADYLKSLKSKESSWYNRDNRQTEKTLVLMDIIRLISSNKNKGRIPVSYFKKTDEDFEHIFCQTPKETKWNENPKENAISLLSFLKENFEKSKSDKDSSYAKYMKIFDNFEENDDYSYEKYMTLLDKFTILHNIGNLLLLGSGINRAYGNAAYIEKRKFLAKKSQEGDYIRPHTWTVFAKMFYSPEDPKNSENSKDFNSLEDFNSWTLKDIESNSEYIHNTIKSFFEK